MFHDFFRVDKIVDKSPIVALTRSGYKKAALFTAIALTTLSLSTGVIPLTVAGVSNQQPATAFVYTDIKDVLSDIPRAYRWLNEGRLKQYYFASFDGNYIQRQYGSSADPVLHRWCSNTFSDSYLRGNIFYWQFWTGGRYVLVASRFENGRGNCYYRGL